jgi:hypothetical protein
MSGPPALGSVPAFFFSEFQTHFPEQNLTFHYHTFTSWLSVKNFERIRTPEKLNLMNTQCYFLNKSDEQERQCTCNITLGQVHVILVAMEKQYIFNILCECLQP